MPSKVADSHPILPARREEPAMANNAWKPVAFIFCAAILIIVLGFCFMEIIVMMCQAKPHFLSGADVCQGKAEEEGSHRLTFEANSSQNSILKKTRKPEISDEAGRMGNKPVKTNKPRFK